MKPKTSSNDTSTWPLQYGNLPPSTEPESETVPQHQNVAELNQKKKNSTEIFSFNCGIPMWSCYQCKLKTLGYNMGIFISWGTFTFLIFKKKSPLKLWVSFRNCLVIFLYIFNHCHCHNRENYKQCNTNIS